MAVWLLPLLLEYIFGSTKKMNYKEKEITLISVIVPCYHQSEELPSCLDSLVNQNNEYAYEIIVVDSGNDPKVQAVCRRYPNVRVISDQGRLLCGQAKNFGAEASDSDLLAFTDSDCIPSKDWLEQAVKALLSGSLMVGGAVLDGQPRNLIAVSDNLLQFSDVPLGRPAGKIVHLPGCNLAITRQAYDAAGGFGEGNSGDDVKLSTEVNAHFSQGIDFKPEMVVRHLGRRTLIDYLRHQHAFGHTRGLLGLRLKPRQQLLGRLWIMLPGVILKRSSYLLKQTARYQPYRLTVYFALSPLLLLGLTAYAIGFRQGCREASTDPKVNL